MKGEENKLIIDSTWLIMLGGTTIAFVLYCLYLNNCYSKNREKERKINAFLQSIKKNRIVDTISRGSYSPTMFRTALLFVCGQHPEYNHYLSQIQAVKKTLKISSAKDRKETILAASQKVSDAFKKKYPLITQHEWVNRNRATLEKSFIETLCDLFVLYDVSPDTIEIANAFDVTHEQLKRAKNHLVKLKGTIGEIAKNKMVTTDFFERYITEQDIIGYLEKIYKENKVNDLKTYLGLGGGLVGCMQPLITGVAKVYEQMFLLPGIANAVLLISGAAFVASQFFDKKELNNAKSEVKKVLKDYQGSSVSNLFLQMNLLIVITNAVDKILTDETVRDNNGRIKIVEKMIGLINHLGFENQERIARLVHKKL